MSVTDPSVESNPGIELISPVWSASLSASDLDFFNRRGYLSSQLEHDLFVLSLNTVPYSVRSLLLL